VHPLVNVKYLYQDARCNDKDKNIELKNGTVFNRYSNKLGIKRIFAFQFGITKTRQNVYFLYVLSPSSTDAIPALLID
jgi:hypothetical protein